MKINIQVETPDFESTSGVSLKKWKSMTEAEKKAYIKKHPNSKYASKTKNKGTTRDLAKIASTRVKIAKLEEDLEEAQDSIKEVKEDILYKKDKLEELNSELEVEREAVNETDDEDEESGLLDNIEEIETDIADINNDIDGLVIEKRALSKDIQRIKNKIKQLSMRI